MFFDFKKIVEELLSSVSLLDDKGQVVRKFDAIKARSDVNFIAPDHIDFDVKQLPRRAYFLHVTYGKD